MTLASPDPQSGSHFLVAFLRAFRWRPIEALGALYWRITGRKVRARNRLRMTTAQTPMAYRYWVEHVEQQAALMAAAPAIMASWQYRPRFSMVLVEQEGWTSEGIDRLIHSLTSQCYPEWELVIVREDGGKRAFAEDAGLRIVNVPSDAAGRALPIGIGAASGDFILPLPAETLLPPTALYRYAAALQTAPHTDILYGDEDRIDDRGSRSTPWFKPQWNEEMVFAQDYVTGACAIRADAARTASERAPAPPLAAAYALVLAIARGGEASITHVPHVQCHMSRPIPDNQAARLEALRDHLADQGAEVHAADHGLLRVTWPLPTSAPLVSIIVPTRDKVNLLKTSVSGLLTGTSYGPIEIIVVDNGSRDPDAVAYLAQIEQDPRVRVLRIDEPFNFSRLNNLAAAQARGEFLCLLNNDTEVIDSAWLTELMRYAVRPHVGAVGAKLLYADGSIQHAGVLIGIGNAAGHAHRFTRNGSPGYFHRTEVPHYVSAVTAACLLVEKKKFAAVGGLDEEHFKVAFNDVDLCLKLEQAGWRNVYAPQAVMVHHESKSRGKDFSPQHIERYRRELGTLQERWNTPTYRDPLHHPSLDRSSETYLISLS